MSQRPDYSYALDRQCDRRRFPCDAGRDLLKPKIWLRLASRLFWNASRRLYGRDGILSCSVRHLENSPRTVEMTVVLRCLLDFAEPIRSRMPELSWDDPNQ